jgi:hypothetical protein
MKSAHTLASTTGSRWKAASIAALALILVSVAAPARAQIVSLAAAAAAHGINSRGTDAAHDPANNVYLVVSSFIVVQGIFVNANGVPVTAPFTISSGTGHVNFTRARYSPHVNNGLGGFMVTWSSEEGRAVHARTRTVSYPGTLGAEHVISDGGAQAYMESSPAIAYSAASRRFLVAWGGITGVKARLVGLDGAPIGEPVQLSAGYARDPAVTWNPFRDDFGVSFSGENINGAGVTTAAYSALAVVPASNPAAFARTTFNVISGSLTTMTDVDFSTQTRRYVMTWYEMTIRTRAAELDENGTLLADGVASFSVGSYDALSLSFNPVTLTFLLVGINPFTDAQSALLLNGHGFPFGGEQTVANGPARYSRVGSSQTSSVWLSTFARLGVPMVQPLHSATIGGGPAGTYASSGGSAPPPPIGGGGGGGGAIGCPGDIPGMVCVNGTWMPGTSGGGGTGGNASGCPGDIPGMTCVNGTWVPGTSAGGGGGSTGGCPGSIPNMTCVNGTWVVGTPPPAGSGSGCPGDIPGMTCVNGTWVPGTSGGGAGNSSGCPGFIPNMTCVNGTWVIGAPPGGGSNSGCPGEIPGMSCVNGIWVPGTSAGGGGGSSSGCPGFIPNMQCLNGNWVIGAPSVGGGGSGCPGDIPGMVCVNGTWMPAASSTGCPGFIANMTCINGNWVVGAPAGNNPGGLCPGDIPNMTCVNGIWIGGTASEELLPASLQALHSVGVTVEGTLPTRRPDATVSWSRAD